MRFFYHQHSSARAGAGRAAAVAASKWESEIAAFERADRTAPPPKGAILFIGSSSIRLWKTLASDFPDKQVINRGFGGRKSPTPSSWRNGLSSRMSRV
jgi:hypothetical protein